MARPAKVKVDYFPHVTHTGKTIAILEARWGNDGYAFWFKLLELLGDSSDFSYNCNNSADWEYILSKARVTEAVAISILDKLAEIDAIDKELWAEKIVWSDHFVSNLEPVFDRRKSAAPQKPGLCLQKPPQNTNEPDSGANNSDKTPEHPTKTDKGKESKAEERRVEQREGETTTSPPHVEIPFASVVQMLTQSICPVSNSIEADTVREWTETLPHNWVTEAIRQAALSKAHSIKYVDKILQSWRAKYRFEDCPWLEEGRKVRAGPKKTFIGQLADIAQEDEES